MYKPLLLVALLFALPLPSLQAREWVDASGKYSQEAELVDFDERIAVLKKANGRLVAVEIEDLSKADRAFLASPEARELVAQEASDDRTWTLADGTPIEGRVVQYGQGNIAIVRRNERLFVNQRPLSQLGELQRSLIPLMVSYLEDRPIETWEQVESLTVANRGMVSYPVEGVLLEPRNEEPFIVPFFMFSKRDLAVLEPGWKDWLAAQKDEYRQQQESTLLRSLANEYQKHQRIDHRIQMLQLASDWFDLWEVELIAPNGLSSFVVVPGRNSWQAQVKAQQECPACFVGATFRVSRRN